MADTNLVDKGKTGQGSDGSGSNPPPGDPNTFPGSDTPPTDGSGGTSGSNGDPSGQPPPVMSGGPGDGGTGGADSGGSGGGANGSGTGGAGSGGSGTAGSGGSSGDGGGGGTIGDAGGAVGGGDFVGTLTNPAGGGLGNAAGDAVSLLNQVGQQANTTADSVATSAGLPETGNGINDTSSTAGVGHIGDNNLITEVVGAPGDIANGQTPVSEVSDILTETGRTVNAAGDAVQDLATDLNGTDGTVQGLTDGLAGGLGGNGNGDPAISVSAGDSTGAPIVDQGILHSAPGDAPVGIALGDPAGLGSIADINAVDGSNGSVLSGDAGAAGSTLAAAGVLSGSDASSPISLNALSGSNVADATLLGTSPLPGELADGLSDGLGGFGGSAAGNAVTGNAGEPGDSPIANAGILTNPTDDSPLGVDGIGGANVLNLGALGSGEGVASLSTDGDSAGLGNLADATALSGAAGNVISGEAGGSGSPVAIVGALTDPSSNSPLAAQVGDGANVADASLLGDNTILGGAGDSGSSLTQSVLGQQSDSVVSGDAGPSGGSPLAGAGVLTDPTPGAPVGIDALTGPDAITANLTGSGDVLNFPNLGGAGSDSLNGLASALPNVGDAGSIVSDGGADQSLVDVGTGGDLVQLHDDPSSLVTLDQVATI